MWLRCVVTLALLAIVSASKVKPDSVVLGSLEKADYGVFNNLSPDDTAYSTCSERTTGHTCLCETSDTWACSYHCVCASSSCEIGTCHPSGSLISIGVAGMIMVAGVFCLCIYNWQGPDLEAKPFAFRSVGEEGRMEGEYETSIVSHNGSQPHPGDRLYNRIIVFGKQDPSETHQAGFSGYAGYPTKPNDFGQTYEYPIKDKGAQFDQTDYQVAYPKNMPTSPGPMSSPFPAVSFHYGVKAHNQEHSSR